MQWNNVDDRIKLSADDESRWTTSYEALQMYGREFGHCNVPQTRQVTLESGKTIKLGMWLDKQRKDRRKLVLREERQAKLQMLVDKGLLKWNIYNNKSS